MTRAWLTTAVVAGVSLLLLSAAGTVARAPAATPRHGSPTFSEGRGWIAIAAPAYRVSFSRQTGQILEIVDRAARSRVVVGSNGCLWAAGGAGPGFLGGCAFGPQRPSRFSYRWDQATATLTLTYASDPAAERGIDAVVTVVAQRDVLDLRLTIENHRPRPLVTTTFPADLLVSATRVEAGYAPNFLPGVRLEPTFFTRVGDNVLRYPSRWAFADFLAVDVAGGHLALYGANPPPSPIAPTDLGFIRNASPTPCSGPSFCVSHAFKTWISEGDTWTSPVVRLHVGKPVEQTILAYRVDNGIDRFRSLEQKVGSRLATLVRAPLVKADLEKGGLPPFHAWATGLRRLPSPALVHPVAFQPGGHDARDPDFLPPDPRWGTTPDLRGAVTAAHSLGQLVMPYLNVGWWDGASPTVQSIPGSAGVREVAVLDAEGKPVVQGYATRSGYLISSYPPYVRQQVDRVLEEWRKEVPADCVFLDQIGARPWLTDFNPASPSPLAYYDGWLALLDRYAERCVMAEDGWDRLGDAFAGFHGGLMLMAREHDWPDRYWGEGNWRPYPLALWLLHDKVLFYQHDLYEGTMTTDPEILTWNLAYGFVLSYDWDGVDRTLDSPWAGLVGAMQRALGPHYAGKPLASYQAVAGTTETVFGDFSVLANWTASTVVEDGHGIPPAGFLAQTEDGSVLAGAFSERFTGAPLSPGTHYLILERSGNATTIQQPLGPDTDLTLEAPDPAVAVTALDERGDAIGRVPAQVAGGRVSFRYASVVGGRAVAAYRVTAA